MGVLISWAIPAANRPIDSIFCMRATWVCKFTRRYPALTRARSTVELQGLQT